MKLSKHYLMTGILVTLLSCGVIEKEDKAGQTAEEQGLWSQLNLTLLEGFEAPEFGNNMLSIQNEEGHIFSDDNFSSFHAPKSAKDKFTPFILQLTADDLTEGASYVSGKESLWNFNQNVLTYLHKKDESNQESLNIDLTTTLTDKESNLIAVGASSALLKTDDFLLSVLFEEEQLRAFKINFSVQILQQES